MTFKQIEKTKEFLDRLNEDNISGYIDMHRFVSELKTFYGDKFKIRLDIYVYNTIESYTKIFNENDKIAIISFLTSVIAEKYKNEMILDILNLIEQGKKSVNSKKNIVNFVAKVYYSYYNVIKFNNSITNITTAAPMDIDINLVQINSNVVYGIINTLKMHAIKLCEEKKVIHNTEKFVIQNNNNNNNDNPSFNNTIDVNINIENAYKQL